MLAAPIDNLRRVRFPVMLSPKLDGMRVLVAERGPLTRQLNPLPNQAMRERLSKPGLVGLDGELIAGDPVEPGVVQRSISAGMARAGRDDSLTFFVFDSFANPSAPFRERLDAAERAVIEAGDPHITFLPHVEVRNLTELEAAEEAIASAGYEGVVLRRPDAPYVYGRVTARSGIMLKHKRRIDAEGVIQGIEGAGIVEGFRVRHPDFAKPFFIALTGPIAQRRDLWAARDRLIGRRIVFTHYAGAWKGEPRAPQFKRLVD